MTYFDKKKDEHVTYVVRSVRTMKTEPKWTFVKLEEVPK